MQRRGFTLIELLVVISIIGLLSSVVLASLNTARERGRMAAGKRFSLHVGNVAGDMAIGIWDFNDCSNSTAIDRSGNGNDGVLTNMTLPNAWSSDTPSGSGCSLFFDGSNDYVLVPASDSLDTITKQLTISVWAKPAAFNTHGGLACYGSDTTNAETFSLNTYSGPNRVSFRSNWPSTWYDLGTQTLGAGSWHQIVATFDSGSAKIYVNGVLANSATWGISTLPLGSDRSLRFGTNQPGSAEYYSGLIDEVRIYAKTLTASDVMKHYAAERLRLGLGGI